MENPIKMDDLGVPLFLETPIPRNGVWKMSEMVEFSIAMSLWPTSILQSFGIFFWHPGKLHFAGGAAEI